MVISARHTGNGIVDVVTTGASIDKADMAVELVAIQQHIVSLIIASNDRMLIALTVEEMLKAFEGVLDKC